MLGGAPDGSPLRFALRAQLRDDPSESPQSSQPKCQPPTGVQAIHRRTRPGNFDGTGVDALTEREL
jgi:hypothetical protein